jgi:hypothetical protein
MYNQSKTSQNGNSYVQHFQEAQMNLIALIKEERLLKRIRKSKQKMVRTYD